MSYFWENVWTGADINDYKRYINLDQSYKFIDIFKQNNISSVCDAACGFGKYSVICSYNNFTVSSFDISKDSVELTKAMLNEFGLKYEQICVSSILDIKYTDACFDGIIAHAVIDHVMTTEAVKALEELYRITKKNGLIYISFDGFDAADNEIAHEVLPDGSFRYSDDSRKDMIFRYYTDDEIYTLLKGREIVCFDTNQHGDREVILRR